MPRVLRIINRLNLGGPTFNAAYLSKYLTPEFETLLVAGMIDETEASSEFITREMGLKPLYIPEMYREPHLLKDYKAYSGIKKLIRDFKPDIVHTHAAKAGALGRLAASECNVPVIVHTFHGHVFHSYFSKWKTNLFIQIEKYLSGKSTRIITVSDRLRQELGMVYRICPMKKIEVVHLGFDLQKFSQNIPEKRKKFRNQFKVDDDEAVIVIVGRLVPIKNHDLFLKAIGQVTAKTSKRIRAFIVGDGEEHERLKAFASSLRLDYADFPEEPRRATITFTSWIKEVDEVYAGADIVALTSMNEGTPVSLIEAQAAGKPIVTTEAGGIADTVLPDPMSFIVGEKDAAAFADVIVRLLEDVRLYEQSPGRVSQLITERYDYRRLIQDMSDLYSRLLSEEPAKRP